MAGRELAPGTPSWVDVDSPDVQASTRFYIQLFGWTADVQTAPEAGGYAIFESNGRRVAGIGPRVDPNQPAAWRTYVNVDDVSAAAARATEAGGEVLVAPMQVLDQGKMAIVRDPTGVTVALWEPEEHRGADLFNEPVSLAWNELWTADVTAAKQFYRDLFGWEPRTLGEGAGEYTEWYLNGQSIGSMQATQAGIPALWLVYFAVADCDATAAKAAATGGRVVAGPHTIPLGKFAVVSDPAGATFAIIQFN